MNVLLLAGYQNKDKKNIALTPFKKQIWLDWQIEQLTRLGHKVSVVLGNDNAEDVLVKSDYLIHCDLVFDTNGSNTNLETNLKSGLFSIPTFTAVLPIEVPCPDRMVWDGLLHHYVKLGAKTDTHWIQSFRIARGKAEPTFPILVTEAGIRDIKRMNLFTGFGDNRLNYSAFPLLTPTNSGQAFNSIRSQLSPA